jgi:CHAT domain-containing protein/uncharacterized protein HemY
MMKNSKFVLLGLFVIIFFAAPNSCLSQTISGAALDADEQEAIKTASIKFLEAAIKLDWKALKEVSANRAADGKVFLPIEKERLENWHQRERFVVERPQFSRLTDRGSEASLRVIVQFRSGDVSQDSLLPYSFDFDFVKIGKEWKVSLFETSAVIFVRRFLSAQDAATEQSLIEEEAELLAMSKSSDVLSNAVNISEKEKFPQVRRLLDAIIKNSKEANIAAEVNWYLGDNFSRDEDYQNAILYFQKSGDFARQTGSNFWQAWSLTGLSESRVYLKQYSEAEQLFADAWNLFLKTSEKPENALSASHRIGNAFFNSKAFETALRIYKQAEEQAEKLKNWQWQARLLKDTGDCYFQTKNYAEAQSFFEKTLALVPATKTDSYSNSLLLEVYAALGQNYRKQRQFEAAAKMYTKACVTGYNAKSVTGVSFAYKNLAEFYVFQGDEIKAIQTYQKLFEILFDWRAGVELAESLEDVSRTIGFDLGRMRKADALLNEWINKGATVFTDKEISKLLLAKAGIAYMRGQWAQAEESLQRMIKLRGATADDRALASFLLLAVYASQGKMDEAVKQFEQVEFWSKQSQNQKDIMRMVALLKIPLLMAKYEDDEEEGVRILKELVSQNNDDDDALIAGINHIFLGIMYFSLLDEDGDEDEIDQNRDEFKKGIAELETSIKYFDKLDDEYKFLSMIPWLGKGMAYFMAKEYDQALSCIEKSKSLFSQAELAPMVVYLNLFEGFVYVSAKRWGEARSVLASSIDKLENSGSNVTGGVNGRLINSSFKYAIYQSMVRTLVELKEKEDALIYSERIKGRILLEFNAVRKNSESAPFPVKTNPKLTSAVVGGKFPQSAAGTKKFSWSKYEEFIPGIEIVIPSDEEDEESTVDAQEIQRPNLPVLSNAQIKNLLPDRETAFLEFFVDKEEIYLFVLAADEDKNNKEDEEAWRKNLEWQIFRIGNLSTIEYHVGVLQNFIKEKADGYEVFSRNIYDMLLKPAEGKLKGKSTLVIVPDDFLWSLPFQALQSRTNHFLLEDYTLYYAPSFSILAQMEEIKANRAQKSIAKTKKDILAIGNPIDEEQVLELKPSNTNPWGTIAGNGNQVTSYLLLSPLPGAAGEAKEISAIYGSSRVQLRIKPVETKQQFINEAGQYSLLHIATHGLLNGESPMDSALVFGQSKKNNAPKNEDDELLEENIYPAEDQLLRAREIMQMQLNANLVILSACDSGNGRVSEGEGLIGLSWAFAASGVPTIVSSQWAIHDKVTAIFMKDFHKQLKEAQEKNKKESGEIVAQALRRTALSMKDKYQHPYYWAAFITVGAQ